MFLHDLRPLGLGDRKGLSEGSAISLRESDPPPPPPPRAPARTPRRRGGSRSSNLALHQTRPDTIALDPRPEPPTCVEQQR